MEDMEDMEDYEKELRNIANELRKMKDGILSDFTGIGHERCATCVQDIAASYDLYSRA